MTYVICYLVLMSGNQQQTPVQAKGLLVSDQYETWVVDFSEFMQTWPHFKEYNNVVQFVNNNECLYVK